MPVVAYGWLTQCQAPLRSRADLAAVFPAQLDLRGEILLHGFPLLSLLKIEKNINTHTQGAVMPRKSTCRHYGTLRVRKRCKGLELHTHTHTHSAIAACQKSLPLNHFYFFNHYFLCRCWCMRGKWARRWRANDDTNSLKIHILPFGCSPLTLSLSWLQTEQVALSHVMTPWNPHRHTDGEDRRASICCVFKTGRGGGLVFSCALTKASAVLLRCVLICFCCCCFLFPPPTDDFWPGSSLTFPPTPRLSQWKELIRAPAEQRDWIEVGPLAAGGQKRRPCGPHACLFSPASSHQPLWVSPPLRWPFGGGANCCAAFLLLNVTIRGSRQTGF